MKTFYRKLVAGTALAALLAAGHISASVAERIVFPDTLNPLGWLLRGTRLEASYVPGFIKSIQRNVVAVNGASSPTAQNNTSVVLANSVIRYLGNDLSAGACIGNPNLICDWGRIELFDATHVKGYWDIADSPFNISWEVIEYRAGVLKSVQRSTINPASVLTATLSPTVNTAKAALTWLGSECGSGGPTAEKVATKLVMTSGSVVTASTGGFTPACSAVGFQVEEYNQ